MGHLNGILARVGGNLNNNFQKSQMPGGLPGGGMLKLRFDRYITLPHLRWRRFFPLARKEQTRAAFEQLNLLFAIIMPQIG